ncbi:hypothetical protein [Fusibacter bizertensis]
MISKKTKNLFGIGLAIVVLIFVGKMIVERSQENRIEYITEKEYQSYSKFGINYDGDESEIFDYLKENLKFDEFELLIENENLVTYKSSSGNNYEFIELHLIDCKEITEILGTKETKEGDFVNYIIDYTNNRNKRIILEYTYTGIVHKTFEENNHIVLIGSDLKKQIYSK